MQTERYQRVAEVIEAQVGGKAFLLHVKDWIYLELNGTAGRIWALLEGQRSVNDLASDLVRTYQIDPAVCAADTAEFLGFMEEKHFVTRSSLA